MSPIVSRAGRGATVRASTAASARATFWARWASPQRWADEAPPRWMNSASATNRACRPSRPMRRNRSWSSPYMKISSSKPPTASQAAGVTAITAPIAAWMARDCP